jgi:hypothetical protein
MSNPCGRLGCQSCSRRNSLVNNGYRASGEPACASLSEKEKAEQLSMYVAVGKHRAAPCQYCPKLSVGCLIGADPLPLCNEHLEDWKKYDMVMTNGFLKYGTIPALVVGR